MNNYYLSDLHSFVHIPLGETLVHKILNESKIIFAVASQQEEHKRDPESWRPAARHWIWTAEQDIRNKIQTSNCLRVKVGPTTDDITLQFSDDASDTWNSSGWVTDVYLCK